VKLEDAIKSWTSRAGVVRVRNVLNPLLWLCGLFTPITWLLVYLLRDHPVLHYLFAVAGLVPMFATLVGYFVFANRDPDRLQSEEFVLRQQELLIIRGGRDDAPAQIETEGQELPNAPDNELRDGEQ